jgi:putative SOS response-associated peptidase YedK
MFEAATDFCIEWGGAYSGVMIDATEELSNIHDKMPVILHPDEHETWLRARQTGHGARAEIPSQ